MTKKLILDLNSINKIFNILENIIKQKNSSIILLRGDLASGKTTFVKHYVKYKNIDDIVTSPTFSLQNIYKQDIFHYDMYNKTLDEFIALGLLEEFEKIGIHFVEWGSLEFQKMLNSYGFTTIVININKYDTKRQYIINA